MPSAVVVGAGIGGLTAAIALRRAGLDVTVLERAPELMPIGGGFTLQPNAVMALRRLQAAQKIEDRSARLRLAELRDDRNRLLSSLSVRASEKLQREAGGPALGIHRGTLQQLLLENLDPDSVHLNKHVVGVRGAHGPLTAVVSDGSGVEGDIIVGADGLHSQMRRAVMATGDPVYAGYYCWRGLTTKSPFPPDWAGEYWGRGRRFGGCAIDGDRFYWFGVVNGPAGGSDPQGSSQAATEAFAGFPAEVRRAIAGTPPETVFRTDIHDRDPVDVWGRQRLTLLGDAAHPMTPNLGQGAAHAIEDSLVLGEQVAIHGPTAFALREYERLRVPRANATVLAARRLGEVAQWERPVSVLMRNGSLRIMRGPIWRRRFTEAWRLPY